MLVSIFRAKGFKSMRVSKPAFRRWSLKRGCLVVGAEASIPEEKEEAAAWKAELSSLNH